MPTDIFPDIDIPVISVVWNYAGLPPEEMEKRIVSNYERGLTTTVNDIEHIESQSLTGIAVIKIFFQPGAQIEAATAQVTAISQTVAAADAARARRRRSSSATAPRTSPSCRLALESDSLSEQQLFDYGTNFIRADIATIQGAQMPWPYGGKQRQIMIDIDPPRLYALGPLAARRQRRARGAERHRARRARRRSATDEYPIVLNAQPRAARRDRDDLPIKIVNGTTVYVRDVANVRDGYAPQTNIVHVDGQEVRAHVDPQAAASASTLDIVDAHPRRCCRRRSRALPKELKVDAALRPVGLRARGGRRAWSRRRPSPPG